MEVSILTTAGVLVVFVLVLMGIIKANLFICQPNEVLIFSGRRRTTRDGGQVGYRVIKGGRGFRIPLLERVDRLDLRTLPLEVSISNAYSKGGIPLGIQGVANVKIAGEEPLLGNALERFLGKPLGEIQDIAKDTLEGNLRGVLASLTPEEVNQDRLKFAQSLIEEADADLQKLGLVLDTLKIQNVSDEVGYLDAIGRRQTAAVLKEAEVAEAENKAEAQEKSSEAGRRGKVAEAQAQIKIVDAQNELRIRKADLDGEGTAAEKRAEQMARKAEVQAQQEVEQERLNLQKKQLENEVIEPARAARAAAELRAKAEAAQILENGLAEIEVLRQKSELWKTAGTSGKELMLIQMLPGIVDRVAEMTKDMKIDHLAVVDSGSNGDGGGGLQSVFKQIGGLTPALFETIKATTGVDLAATLANDKEEIPEKATT
jgi:flotillin